MVFLHDHASELMVHLAAYDHNWYLHLQEVARPAKLSHAIPKPVSCQEVEDKEADTLQGEDRGEQGRIQWYHQEAVRVRQT